MPLWRLKETVVGVNILGVLRHEVVLLILHFPLCSAATKCCVPKSLHAHAKANIFCQTAAWAAAEVAPGRQEARAVAAFAPVRAAWKAVTAHDAALAVEGNTTGDRHPV